MRNLLTILGALLLITACTPEPSPIEYGADECDFCRMTIVDKQHAAEVVTLKGKPFKFDAIECMVHYVHHHNDKEYAMYLVNDYFAPGELVDAQASTFLISDNLPSPMGAFLTGFSDHAAAKNVQEEKTGDLYTWEELMLHMKP